MSQCLTAARKYLLENLDPANEQDVAVRVGSLQALTALWSDEVRAAFVRSLGDREVVIRRLAADGLGRKCAKGDRETHEALVKVLADEDLGVRRSVALAVGRINADGAADVIVNAYQSDEGRSSALTRGYVRAVESCGKTGIERLIGLAKSGNDAGRDRAVAAFLELRTRAGAEAIPDLLGDPHLTEAQRVAVIRSYANYRLSPPVSLDPLLDYLTKDSRQPPAALKAAIDLLAETGNLKGARAVNFLTTLLDAERAADRLTALAAIEKARLADAGPRLVQALGDGKRPAGERAAIMRALGAVNDKSATPALRAVFDNPEPVVVRVEALRALNAIDPAAARPVAEGLLEQPDAQLLAQAVNTLGQSPEGAKLVGRRLIEKKLPEAVRPEVTAALRKHPRDAEAAELLARIRPGARE